MWIRVGWAHALLVLGRVFAHRYNEEVTCRVPRPGAWPGEVHKILRREDVWPLSEGEVVWLDGGHGGN